tara:strand:+ start:1253 stop:2425 length:1173 start_codon:yes stop_codon:yes gene_type:complete
MDEQKIVINCPVCGGPTRIPLRETVLKIICPSCKSDFHYSASTGFIAPATETGETPDDTETEEPVAPKAKAYQPRHENKVTDLILPGALWLVVVANGWLITQFGTDTFLDTSIRIIAFIAVIVSGNFLLSRNENISWAAIIVGLMLATKWLGKGNWLFIEQILAAFAILLAFYGLLRLITGRDKDASRVSGFFKVSCVVAVPLLSIATLVYSDIWDAKIFRKNLTAMVSNVVSDTEGASCAPKALPALMQRLGLLQKKPPKVDLPKYLTFNLSDKKIAHAREAEKILYDDKKTMAENLLRYAAHAFKEQDFELGLQYMGLARKETRDLPGSYYFYYAYMVQKLSHSERYSSSTELFARYTKDYANTYLALSGDCAVFKNEARILAQGKEL